MLRCSFLISLLGVSACGGNSGGASRHDAAIAVDASVSDSAPSPSATVSVSNVEASCTPYVLNALPEENHQYTATTLTPPRYPFVVEKVKYALVKTANQMQGCTGKFAHTVLVWASATDKPTNTPSLEFVAPLMFRVPEAADASRDVELPVSGLTLQSGQRLVVAVEMIAESEAAKNCIAACKNGAANRDWWSNKTSEPFMWADLVKDFGFTQQSNISVVGH